MIVGYENAARKPLPAFRGKVDTELNDEASLSLFHANIDGQADFANIAHQDLHNPVS
jgi:hypothetical protein